VSRRWRPADEYLPLAPHAARARIHPRCAGDAVVFIRSADDSGVPVIRKRDRKALLLEGASACADEFRLLAPHAARARIHPRCAGTNVVIRPADDGGIPVIGKRDRKALPCARYAARADQFHLLAPRPALARVYPRGADIVVRRPTHDSGIPVTGQRDRKALRCGIQSVCSDQFCLLAELSLCRYQQ